MEGLARFALFYLRLGYAVLPLEPGEKRPHARLAPNGLKNATQDPGLVRRWWSEDPRAGLGILPPPGVLALDIDRAELVGEMLDRFALHAAPRQRTARGGAHLFLKLPPGARLSATTKALPGIDLRGMGRAYVVSAPTTLPSGKYAWERPLLRPEDLPEIPRPLLDLLLPPPPRPATWGPASPSPRRLRAILESFAAAVAGTPEGSRHNVLIRYARAAGGLIPHGLAREEAMAALVEAALRAGLPEWEARAAAAWGLEVGERVPLPLTDFPTQAPFSDKSLSEKLSSSWTAKRAFSDKNAWGGEPCRW